MFPFFLSLHATAFKRAEGLVNVGLVPPTLNHSHPNLDLEPSVRFATNHMLLFCTCGVCNVESSVIEHECVNLCMSVFDFFDFLILRLRFFAFIEAVIEGHRMHDCEHVTPLYKHTCMKQNNSLFPPLCVNVYFLALVKIFNFQ